MNMVEKSMDAAVKPVESQHPNGEFEVVLSTEDLDRDKENLWLEEWKQPLPARIHIDGDHGRSLEKTVGSAVPRIEDGKLIGKGTFAGTEYAQMVRQLVNEGHINSVSVTYSESKNQKGEGVQRELLNAAFVAIPANPKAVVLASKAKKREEDNKPSDEDDRDETEDNEDEDETQEPKKTKKAFLDVVEQLYGGKAAGGLSASGDNPQVPKHDAMVQAIHDAACHLGAMCANEIDADPGTADGANKTVKTSSRKAGSPQESAEESAVSAAAEKSAAAETAEESAEDTARERLAAKARSLAFLTKQSSFRSSHAQ